MALAPSTGFLDHGKIRGIDSPPKRTVRQVSVERKALAPMTNNTAESLHWVGGAYLRQPPVARETVLWLAGQCRDEFDGPWLHGEDPPLQDQGGCQNGCTDCSDISLHSLDRGQAGPHGKREQNQYHQRRGHLRGAV